MSNPSGPGRLLVDVLSPNESRAYRWDIEVVDYEGEGCERVQEGVGFDYFIDGLEDIDGVGRWLIEGIVSTYYPASGWFDEADEDIEVENVSRVAGDYELV